MNLRFGAIAIVPTRPPDGEEDLIGNATTADTTIKDRNADGTIGTAITWDEAKAEDRDDTPYLGS
jgi:hypothetical protein